jgi:hypothetical protein
MLNDRCTAQEDRYGVLTILMCHALIVCMRCTGSAEAPLQGDSRRIHTFGTLSLRCAAGTDADADQGGPTQADIQCE